MLDDPESFVFDDAPINQRDAYAISRYSTVCTLRQLMLTKKRTSNAWHSCPAGASVYSPKQ